MAIPGCNFTTSEVLKLCIDFWNTEEGNIYCAKIDSISIENTIEGIKKNTGNIFTVYILQGVINGWLHTPEGIIHNYINTNRNNVDLTKVTTLDFIEHASKYGIILDEKDIETALVNMGAIKK